MNWPRTHWWVGTITLVLFLLSGAYMRWIVHVPELQDITRAVYRSRHLFVLLAALANLALSAGPQPLRRVQRVISTLVMLAPVLLLTAFLVEPEQGIVAAPWSQLGLYLLFGASALLVIENRPRP